VGTILKPGEMVLIPEGEVHGTYNPFREPVVFLGPIAVEAELRKHRIGQTLVEMACEASTKAGWRAVLLVGDAPYFGRVGFDAAPAKAVCMPGPVDQRRVLLKALREGGARADRRAAMLDAAAAAEILRTWFETPPTTASRCPRPAWPQANRRRAR
jgi:hypothetical protein